MIKVDPTLLIIIAEVVVGLVVILAAVLFFFIKRRKADKQALADLNKHLKTDTDKRQKVLEESIAKSCGGGENNDEVATENEEMAKKWCDKENAFYSRLVTMYIQRDSTALKSLDKLLHEYTSSHLDAVAMVRERFDAERSELSEELGQRLEKLEQDGQTLASEVGALKDENQRLSTELEKANTEIDQAMDEYTRMAVTGSVSKTKAAAKEPEPIEEPVVSILEDEDEVEVEVESDAEVSVEDLVADIEAGLEGQSDAGGVDEAGLEQVSELEMELQAEPVPVESGVEPEQSDEFDNDEADTLVDMSILDEIDVEPVVAESPGEVIEDAVPEAVQSPDKTVEGVDSKELEMLADIVGEAVSEEESLEDVVLHAMAEESAAQQTEAEVEVDVDEDPALVIDLAKDDEIVLPLMPEKTVAPPESELLSEEQSIDGGGINEDELLAQLAEIEGDDDFGSLDGFGELPEPNKDEDKKPAG